jgi:hypothetical protein
LTRLVSIAVIRVLMMPRAIPTPITYDELCHCSSTPGSECEVAGWVRGSAPQSSCFGFQSLWGTRYLTSPEYVNGTFDPRGHLRFAKSITHSVLR